jgi:hypothetical protein
MIKLSDILKEVKDTSKTIIEIGDASAKPYKWELAPTNYRDDAIYKFTTDLGTEYRVEISTDDYIDKNTKERIPSAWIMFLAAYHLERGDPQDPETGNIESSSSGKGKKSKTKDIQDTQYTSTNKYWSTIISTNKGELYRVMATITDIIKEFLKNTPSVKALIYEPSKKSSEQGFGTQRDMLYQSFIKKAIPSAQILKQGDKIIAKI